MIFNFAILCKVHFSFKKWRKSILKIDSANRFCMRVPLYASYPRRARTLRRRSVQWSLRCASVLLCMTSTAAGMVPSGEATLVGTPPTARHWPPGQPQVAEPCRPRRTCSGHRGDITSSQLTFRGYINTSPTAPHARTPPPELHRPPLPPSW
jgi:hypothetical protein